jgi:hypothetical protein
MSTPLPPITKTISCMHGHRVTLMYAWVRCHSNDTQAVVRALHGQWQNMGRCSILSLRRALLQHACSDQTPAATWACQSPEINAVNNALDVCPSP